MLSPGPPGIFSPERRGLWARVNPLLGLLSFKPGVPLPGKTGMPRTAFVHIGVPKTGSTAIQAAFSEARADLRAAGYHYPSGAPNHGERLALAFWDRADALRRPVCAGRTVRRRNGMSMQPATR